MARNDTWHQQHPLPSDADEIARVQWREAHDAACDCAGEQNGTGDSPEEILKSEEHQNLNEAIQDCD